MSLLPLPKKYIHSPNLEPGLRPHFRSWSREELIAHLVASEKALEARQRHGLAREQGLEAAVQKLSEEKKALLSYRDTLTQNLADTQQKYEAVQRVLSFGDLQRKKLEATIAERDAAIVALVLKLIKKDPTP